jgi:hypothetical protein
MDTELPTFEAMHRPTRSWRSCMATYDVGQQSTVPACSSCPVAPRTWRKHARSRSCRSKHPLNWTANTRIHLTRWAVKVPAEKNRRQDHRLGLPGPHRTSPAVDANVRPQVTHPARKNRRRTWLSLYSE